MAYWHSSLSHKYINEISFCLYRTSKHVSQINKKATVCMFLGQFHTSFGGYFSMLDTTCPQGLSRAKIFFCYNENKVSLSGLEML